MMGKIGVVCLGMAVFEALDSCPCFRRGDVLSHE